MDLNELLIEELKQRRIEDICNDSAFADCGDYNDNSDKEFYD